MDPEHSMALGGVLFLPVAVMAALILLQALRSRSRRAESFVAALDAAPAAVRVAALLLLTSAAVHASLVPQHLHGETVTGALFLLDAIALTAAAPLTLAGTRARLLVIALLLAGIGTYGVYLAIGLEQPDVIGLATKALELIAVTLLVHAARVDPAGTHRAYAPEANVDGTCAVGGS